MKAEHRKELHTNELADSVGKLIQGVKAGPSRSTLVMAAAALALVGGFFGVRYLVRANQKQASAAWVRADEASRKLAAAPDLGQVDKVLEDLGAPAGRAATLADRTVQFTRARTLLRQGVEWLYAEKPEREKARQHIEDAGQLYGELAGQTASVPLLHQEALMGRAKAQESLGRLDEALKGYEELARRYPGTARGKAAEERVKYLQEHDKEVRQLYATLLAPDKPSEPAGRAADGAKPAEKDNP